MKVVICAHDAPRYINGPNIWLQRTLPELSLRGIRPRVLFFASKEPEQCSTIQSLLRVGIPCEIYDGKRYSEFQVRWILERLAAEPADLFVPNLIVPAYHACLWVKRAGIPTLGVLHSDDPFYRAIIDEFVRKPVESPLTGMVCVSELLAGLVGDIAGKNITVRTIPYGVPIPRETARRGSSLRIIYAGRLVEEQKRISDVTRALCLVVKAVPGTEAVLYGGGSAEGDVRRMIREAEAENRIRLGGLISQPELGTHFLKGQVFALLSDYEGLPIALLEAMACGLVPICTRMRSGIPQLVEHEVTGLLVDDRRDSFVQAVDRLSQEDGLWERLSQAARRRVEAAFSVEKSVGSWTSLLEELSVAAGGPRGPIVAPRRLTLPRRHPDIPFKRDARWPGRLRHTAHLLKRALRRS